MDFNNVESKSFYDDELTSIMMGSLVDDDDLNNHYSESVINNGDFVSSSSSPVEAVIGAALNFINLAHSNANSIVDQTITETLTTPSLVSQISKSTTNHFVKLNTNKTHYFRYFRDHRKFSYYYPYEKYLSYYPLFLIIIGTICNLTSFLVMHKKNMSKHSCMRYLSILSLTDVIVLYQWNLNTFFKYNLSRPPIYSDLEEISLFWCRWIAYLSFTSLQMSSWLLSLVSFDRFMIIYSRWWRTHIMSEPKTVNLIIICLATFICLLNSHLLFFNGYIKMELKITQKNSNNQIASSSPSNLISSTANILLSTATSAINQNNYNLTNILGFNSTYDELISNSTNVQKVYEQVVVCYKSLHNSQYIFPNWQRVHLLMYNFIPFSIMVICNSMIIYNIKFHSSHKIKTKSKSNSKRKTRTSFMLVLVTFSFMCLTLPSVIVHNFFRDFLGNKPYRRLVNLIVNNLLHTSHAIDFFLYVFTAPNFRAELYVFFAAIYAKITRKSSRDINSMGLTRFATRRKANQNVSSQKKEATTSKKASKNLTAEKAKLNSSNNNKSNELSTNNIITNNNNSNANEKMDECLLKNDDLNKFEITKESF